MAASVSAMATPSGGGTLYLIFAQIASRAFTFLGNQFLLRYLSPSLLGLAVQLELLSVTVLYFARESLRVTLQRQSTGGRKGQKISDASQQAVNLSYFSVAIGLCASGGFGYAYLRQSSIEVLTSDDFWPAFQLYAVATFIELGAEPSFVVIQQHALYKSRARAETAAAMARCVAASIAARTMYVRQSPASVLPFAIGQLFYAITLFSAYLTTIIHVTKLGNFSILPRSMAPRMPKSELSAYWLNLFSKRLLSLTTTFYAQSVFKLLLTQGDSLILSFLTDLKSQGAFALASNYGGLLSRLVFQPVEESSRNVFGGLLGTSTDANNPIINSDSDSSPSHEKTSEHIESNTDRDAHRNTSNINSVDSASSSLVHYALNHLSTTLHFYILFAIPILSLLPPLIPPLTSFLLAAQWRTTETAALLHAYIQYLPFLAVNGILDALVTTVATPAQLRDQSFIMACVTAAYSVVAWLLMGSSDAAVKTRILLRISGGSALGSSGLVYANMFNMALRITYSAWFVDRWIKNVQGGGKDVARQIWRQSLPSLSCVVAGVAVTGGLRYVLQDQYGTKLLGSGTVAPPKSLFRINGLSFEILGYILTGAVVLGSTIILSERRFLINTMEPFIPKRLATKFNPYFEQSKAEKRFQPKQTSTENLGAA